jgi:DNA-binding Lrp family transcriptional regulator
MLAQLLALLKEGGLHTTGELATELGASRDLVEAMLTELAQRGYLKRMAADCSAHCAACPLNGFCRPSATTGGRLFALSQATAHDLSG